MMGSDIMHLFKNVKVITENDIIQCDVLTDGKKIIGIAPDIQNSNAEITDGKGCYLAPGFIDLHVHGGGGFSAMGGKEAVLKMAKAHAKYGTTSILPTTLAAPLCQLQTAIDGIYEARKENPNILGAHLEGPFLSPKMCGAQSSDGILVPKKEDYKGFIDKNKNIIKMMGAAPETDVAKELGKYLTDNSIVASIAHSAGDYDTAMEAVENGYTDITHLYNACTSCYKKGVFRYAGTVEAALSDDRFTTQVISDLRHLPAGVLKLIYKCKGADKMYLITDGLEYSAMDIKDGEEFTQENGVSVVYEDDVMKLSDRSCLAGSTANGARLVRNMYKEIGVPLTEAVKMMSLTPAKVIGVDNYKGKIAENYDADIILFDDDINIKSVMVLGEIQF